MKWFRFILPDCKEAIRLQSEARDHALPNGTRVRLAVHLALCKWCRRYGKHLELIHKAAEKMETDPGALPNGTISLSAKERIQRAMTNTTEGNSEKKE